MKRPARGERHPKARLTEEDVLNIRAAYKGTNRPTLAELAEQYGVSFGHISSVVTRRTWKHVADKPPVTSTEVADLLGILAHAHRVLDARDQERGTFVPPEQRRRHIPQHHPEWHQ